MCDYLSDATSLSGIFPERIKAQTQEEFFADAQRLADEVRGLDPDPTAAVEQGAARLLGRSVEPAEIFGVVLASFPKAIAGQLLANVTAGLGQSATFIIRPRTYYLGEAYDTFAAVGGRSSLRLGRAQITFYMPTDSVLRSREQFYNAAVSTIEALFQAAYKKTTTFGVIKALLFRHNTPELADLLLSKSLLMGRIQQRMAQASSDVLPEAPRRGLSQFIAAAGGLIQRAATKVAQTLYPTFLQQVLRNKPSLFEALFSPREMINRFDVASTQAGDEAALMNLRQQVASTISIRQRLNMAFQTLRISAKHFVSVQTVLLAIKLVSIHQWIETNDQIFTPSDQAIIRLVQAQNMTPTEFRAKLQEIDLEQRSNSNASEQFEPIDFTPILTALDEAVTQQRPNP